MHWYRIKGSGGFVSCNNAIANGAYDFIKLHWVDNIERLTDIKMIVIKLQALIIHQVQKLVINPSTE